VSDYTVINRQFLWAAMLRGAAILCAERQEGIDAIIIGCREGEKISQDNIFPMPIQFKNALAVQSYDQILFDSMDPVKLGILSGYETPLIRIVISLDSDQPGVEVATPPPIPPKPREVKTNNLKRRMRCSMAYDIHAQSASDMTFAVIHKDDVPTYKNILKSRVSDIYELNGKDAVTLSRNMHPCVLPHTDHFANFAEL